MMGASAEGSRGPIIVLAGEGVFFDCMMCQKDNDNLMFAMNCASFLMEVPRFVHFGSSPPPARPRQHMLFISNGEVLTSFALPGLAEPKTPTGLPPPLLTTELINKVLFRLQSEGVFYRGLEGAMSPGRGWKGLIALGSLVLFVYASWPETVAWPLARWMPGCHGSLIQARPTGAARRAVAGPARRGPCGVDNHAEPAQTLARQWFWHLAGVSPVRWDEPDFRCPTFRLTGTWLERWRLTRKLAQLRRFAEDATACSVSGRALGECSRPRRADAVGPGGRDRVRHPFLASRYRSGGRR